MIYYFLSNVPAAVKIGGIFKGLALTEPLKLDLSFPSPFIEVCPEKNGYGAPLGFIAGPEFLSDPPERVTVTDLKGGYAVCFDFTRTEKDFKSIAVYRTSFAIVNVFSQSGYFISIETQFDFFTEELPLTTESAEFFVSRDKTTLVVGLTGDKKAVIAYDISEKVKKTFCEEVSDFTLGEETLTSLNREDVAKHSVVIKYSPARGTLSVINKEVGKDKNFSPARLITQVIPYAFLEEFLVGGDFKNYLAGGVYDNANKLKPYLGDFIGVLPPPRFITDGRPENENIAGLIYKKTERTYYAEYFCFTVRGGKILNLKKLD